MSNKQRHSTLKEAREAVYSFFEEKGFVFPKDSKNFLSQAIKDYAAKHNEILMEQNRILTEKIKELSK